MELNEEMHCPFNILYKIYFPANRHPSGLHVTHLKKIVHFIVMFYNALPKNKVLEIYSFVMKKREEGFGQRTLSRMVKERFNKKISENTIAGWIFYEKIPFGNERTQFKPLPKPSKKELYELYIRQKQSAQNLAKTYSVSTIIVINWLRSYNINPRTHLESMNTPGIKEELKEKRLRRPTKDFSKLTPEKAYLLGVLCGDGHIRPGAIRLEIRYDEEFIKRFTECLNTVYGLDFRYKYYEKKNSFVMSITSEIISKDLLRYGRFGTFEWSVPKDILKSSDTDIISNFLKGMYDSEGSVCRSAITLGSVSKRGIDGMGKLLKLLGIKSKVSIYKEKYYYLYIFRKERFKIYREKIGFTIKRKQEKLDKVLANGISYKQA